MNTATLNIGKQVTVIIGGCVTSEKMGNFVNVVTSMESVKLTGMSKPAKKSKYENLLLNAGFKVSSVDYCHNAEFDGINSDVISYSISFSK